MTIAIANNNKRAVWIRFIYFFCAACRWHSLRTHTMCRHILLSKCEMRWREMLSRDKNRVRKSENKRRSREGDQMYQIEKDYGLLCPLFIFPSLLDHLSLSFILDSLMPLAHVCSVFLSVWLDWNLYFPSFVVTNIVYEKLKWERGCWMVFKKIKIAKIYEQSI